MSRDSTGEPATPREIQAAVEALSTAALTRIRRFARFRARGLGSAGFGLDAEDLVQDAVLKSLSGDRAWRKDSVGFVAHLMGVIQSDASHWGEKVERRALTVTAADMRRPDGPGGEDDPLEQEPSRSPDAERITAAKEAIKTIEGLFSDDEVVQQVILGLTEGMKGPEIQHTFDMTTKEHDAAMKRMRQKVRGVFSRGGSDA